MMAAEFLILYPRQWNISFVEVRFINVAIDIKIGKDCRKHSIKTWKRILPRNILLIIK